jgi:hypothetical protein
MFVCCVCCQVEVSATDWSLVQRSPTGCGASFCVIKKPRGTRRPPHYNFTFNGKKSVRFEEVLLAVLCSGSGLQLLGLVECIITVGLRKLVAHVCSSYVLRMVDIGRSTSCMANRITVGILVPTENI